jgi:hypothetical protein
MTRRIPARWPASCVRRSCSPAVPAAEPVGSAQSLGRMPAEGRCLPRGSLRPAGSPEDGRALSGDRVEVVGWPCEATIWHVLPESQPPAGADPVGPSPRRPASSKGAARPERSTWRTDLRGREDE